MEDSCWQWGFFAALLTDLCKAFDCIRRDLIIAKLAAYGFDTNALKPINNYLTGSKEWKLILLTAYEKIYFMVFHKVP